MPSLSITYNLVNHALADQVVVLCQHPGFSRFSEHQTVHDVACRIVTIETQARATELTIRRRGRLILRRHITWRPDWVSPFFRMEDSDAVWGIPLGLASVELVEIDEGDIVRLRDYSEMFADGQLGVVTRCELDSVIAGSAWPDPWHSATVMVLGKVAYDIDCWKAAAEFRYSGV